MSHSLLALQNVAIIAISDSKYFKSWRGLVLLSQRDVSLAVVVQSKAFPGLGGWVFRKGARAMVDVAAQIPQRANTGADSF
jgi:hypothetical protein